MGKRKYEPLEPRPVVSEPGWLYDLICLVVVVLGLLALIVLSGLVKG